MESGLTTRSFPQDSGIQFIRCHRCMLRFLRGPPTRFSLKVGGTLLPKSPFCSLVLWEVWEERLPLKSQVKSTLSTLFIVTNISVLLMRGTALFLTFQVKRLKRVEYICFISLRQFPLARTALTQHLFILEKVLLTLPGLEKLYFTWINSYLIIY